MELPGGGSYGFDVPVASIRGITAESSIGIFAMIEKVAIKYKSKMNV